MYVNCKIYVQSQCNSIVWQETFCGTIINVEQPIVKWDKLGSSRKVKLRVVKHSYFIVTSLYLFDTALSQRHSNL